MGHLFLVTQCTYQQHVFFFFQAEDGIRDKLVTGVQTCALPISSRRVTCPISSTASGGPTPRARAPASAPGRGRGSPSSTGSPGRTAARFTGRGGRGGGPPSPRRCPPAAPRGRGKQPGGAPAGQHLGSGWGRL